ncbi:hypothetical protein RUM43_012740 [Polyplax serrata]|uniref:Protein kinase domain-containing protein n=1 Tax=Polyplax serrata TaxID=468196 RepID=A0AAN8S421_POLSC
MRKQKKPKHGSRLVVFSPTNVLPVFFSDEEDLFMVSDLFTGGDLRYHIQQKVHFKEDCVRLYVLELGLALEYLQSKLIVHRDVKPDNILLDENGHAHLTDFNIATVLREGQLATSMSGTKPYMAPEIFACVTDDCVGYNFAVDWWSLGVCAYEMLALARPYDIHSTTSINDVQSLFHSPLIFPRSWTPGTIDLLSKLLCVEPGARISSLSELKTVLAISKFDVSQVLEKKVKPSFTPAKDHLNCDPTLELEEMIVETKPLHKKKKRLAKQRSLQPAMSLELSTELPNEIPGKVAEFRVYNREQELRRRELERKEKQWEEELLKSMKLCELTETTSRQQSNPPQSLSSHNLNKSKLNKYKNLKKSSSYSYCICEEKSFAEESKIPDKQNSYECTCESEEYKEVPLSECDVVPESQTAKITN